MLLGKLLIKGTKGNRGTQAWLARGIQDFGICHFLVPEQVLGFSPPRRMLRALFSPSIEQETDPSRRHVARGATWLHTCSGLRGYLKFSSNSTVSPLFPISVLGFNPRALTLTTFSASFIKVLFMWERGSL